MHIEENKYGKFKSDKAYLCHADIEGFGGKRYEAIYRLFYDGNKGVWIASNEIHESNFHRGTAFIETILDILTVSMRGKIIEICEDKS